MLEAHLALFIMRLLGIGDEPRLGMTVNAERQRQAKSAIERGLAFLRYGDSYDANVQFGVALALDHDIASKLDKNRQEMLLSTLRSMPECIRHDRLWHIYEYLSSSSDQKAGLKSDRNKDGSVRAGVNPCDLAVAKGGSQDMNITVRTVGEVHILDCIGSFITVEDAMAFRKRVRELLQQGGKRMLLNLAQVDKISAQGIGELFGCYTVVAERGGEARFLISSEVRKRILEAKVSPVLPVFENEQMAIDSFYSDRG